MLRLQRFLTMTSCIAILAALLILPCSLPLARTERKPEDDAGGWSAYGHDAGGTRFSPLKQIHRGNVAKLKVAWIYRTGDILDAKQGPNCAFEATPVLADGKLYFITPFCRVIALDAETGAERWTFDPKILRGSPFATDPFASRGVSVWVDTQKPADAPDRSRVFFGTYDGRLFALNAADGKLCADFGKGGEIDLKHGVGEVQLGEYQITSPPALFQNLVIVGAAISDNRRVNAPSGMVRAFDARTGALRWKFEPVPRDPNDPARKTWGGASADITGAANAWSIISVDAARDLIFIPTGSASPDFYGGERIGDNRYANCVVALRAGTGKVVWHFQVVHHDIWDYDVPAQPNLVTVRRNGKDVPAVAVATKVGHLFLLHRETGEPLFPIEERPVPQDAVAGERPSPTQPFPVLPRPLVPQSLSPEDAWGPTPADREIARKRIASLRYGGIFTPPSLQGTILYPGNIGGMNWSGTAFDPLHNLLILNTNRLATLVTLIPRSDLSVAQRAHPDSETSAQSGTPYAMRREWLVSETTHLPQTSPPWGMLSAIDLTTGALRWQVPLGVEPRLSGDAKAAGWGTINLGGSMVTAGGLVFIAATRDSCLRAFDVESGKELWKTPLPAGGNAAPMTYRAPKSGRQFVVLCAGGHRGLGTPLGDYVVAYALP